MNQILQNVYRGSVAYGKVVSMVEFYTGVVIGIVVLCLAVMMIRNAMMDPRKQQTTGTVLDTECMEKESEICHYIGKHKKTKQCQTTTEYNCNSTIQFTDLTNQSIQSHLTSTVNSKSNQPKTGNSIQILYDPNNPRYIKSYDSIGFGQIGSSFILLTIIILTISWARYQIVNSSDTMLALNGMSDLAGRVTKKIK